ncbi:hypothetical protein [Agrobacterium pusense]|uniref:hypothetical protein n=1 Tax=Agrobacterium pusense TaxID=648995 RepID=UPI00345E608E
MSERRDLYFSVEGGKTLELALAHVAKRIAVIKKNNELAKELGAQKYVVDISKGTISGVMFDGAINSDFKKPNKRGVSYPKKGSDWERRLLDMDGYDARGYELARALGVPTTISYKNETSHGNAVISHGFNSGVGLLYLSEGGPFALYIPDIAPIVAEYEAQGYSVGDDCRNFKPEFDGARPILKEEWELSVARHKLLQAEKAVAA